ncbi:hypothetical protein AB1L88_13230 [Tautonia sp. JC769]|uniref:hypothetical protein n=1 Tax=Tautonia sp. JC769 TaxID=3232135 RepID=UPI0034586B00
MRSIIRAGTLCVALLSFGSIVGCGGDAPTIDDETPPPAVEPGQVDPGPPTAAEGGNY